MAFDSGMVFCVCDNLRKSILNGKVDKIVQPEKDEFIFVIRKDRELHRLLICVSSNVSRVCLTKIVKENPSAPPSMCMLLRKHLSGAKLIGITQQGFERVILFSFEAYDEMGFKCEKKLYVEIIGKNSNMVFCDKDDKVIFATHYNDLSSDLSRHILPNLRYEMPPKQDKIDPFSDFDFFDLYRKTDTDMPICKFIGSVFMGISALNAREIVYKANYDIDTTMSEADPKKIYRSFNDYKDLIDNCNFSPCLLFKGDDETPFEYSFWAITQYGNNIKVINCNVNDAIDDFFYKKDKSERNKQRYNDVFQLLKNARNRLQKKIVVLHEEIEAAENFSEYKKNGDLITQELYKLPYKTDKLITLDYSFDPPKSVVIKLDDKLTPVQNAQKYYREYSKKKVAKEKLKEQIDIANEELKYVDTVLDSLSRAETEDDFKEIRQELSTWEYGKKKKLASKKNDKPHKLKIKTFTSLNGFKVLLGKNNVQNDYITTTLAKKNDYWFHVKDAPGSHVVLVCDGKTPQNEDLTFAAEIAAKNSSFKMSDIINVDYTQIKNVKKPNGAKPGFVIYDKYNTAVIKTNK